MTVTTIRRGQTRLIVCPKLDGRGWVAAICTREGIRPVGEVKPTRQDALEAGAKELLK